MKFSNIPHDAHNIYIEVFYDKYSCELDRRYSTSIHLCESLCTYSRSMFEPICKIFEFVISFELSIDATAGEASWKLQRSHISTNKYVHAYMYVHREYKRESVYLSFGPDHPSAWYTVV